LCLIVRAQGHYAPFWVRVVLAYPRCVPVGRAIGELRGWRLRRLREWHGIRLREMEKGWGVGYVGGVPLWHPSLTALGGAPIPATRIEKRIKEKSRNEVLKKELRIN
jgi:hypothetical protein